MKSIQNGLGSLCLVLVLSMNSTAAVAEGRGTIRDQGTGGVGHVWTGGRGQLVALQSSLRSPGQELLISHNSPRSQVHFSSFRFLLQTDVLEGFAHPAIY